MKAKLEFDLPEDQSMFNASSHGLDWYMVALSMDSYLRARLKYHDEYMSDETRRELLKARDSLHEFMENRGVSLEDVE